MDAITGRPSRSGRKLIMVAAVAALAVAMAMSTRFLTPAEAEAINPAPFNSQTYAKDAFPKVTAKIKETAVDLVLLVPAVRADPAAAGAKYGHDLGSGSYAFPVKATGKVTSVDADFAVLEVAGIPAGSTVRIPLAAAISGSPVRDATGIITFGDFVDQTDFQSVANQFKLRIQTDVIAKLDVAALMGKQLTVFGAYSTIGAANSYIIQPVSIEVVP